MIHTSTYIKRVNDAIGNGVFASQKIPKGTIVVVKDSLDISMSLEDFRDLPSILKESIETYMYHSKTGELVLSWDHARYMNHSCCCNTMMTDYNIEIAIRDILPGEEITTEYGLLNIQEPYEIHCNCPSCRKFLLSSDIDNFADEWDKQIVESMMQIPKVPQVLMETLDQLTKDRIQKFLIDSSTYSSVRNLKWKP